MKHTLVHEEIKNGAFAGGMTRFTAASAEEGLEYYEATLKAPLAHRIKEQRAESMRLFDDLRKSIDESHAIAGDDPTAILAPERAMELKKLYATPDEQRVLKIGWPNIWKVHLYQHKNHEGKKYTLNCAWTDFPYDVSLVDNHFNDIASSIDTGKFVLVTICAEHTWFRGEWWWFFVDDKNFANNGCNDRISSIAATAVSIPSLVRLLAALVG